MIHFSTSQQVTPPLNAVTSVEPGLWQAALKAALDLVTTAQKTAPPVTPPDAPPGWDKLKPGHRAVLRLIAGGHSTAAIAEQRCQSPHAVHSQRAAICRALNLSGNNCLLLFAERHRTWLLQTPDE